MTTREIDSEALAIGWLKSYPALVELVDVEMISGRLRRALRHDDAAVRVRRIGGLPTEQQTARLTRYRLQVDAFAPTEEDAFELAATADVALRSLDGETRPEGFVSAVRKDFAITNSPDPASDLSRYTFGIVLYATPPRSDPPPG